MNGLGIGGGQRGAPHSNLCANRALGSEDERWTLSIENKGFQAVEHMTCTGTDLFIYYLFIYSLIACNLKVMAMVQKC
jgi:hypothetical protein